MHSVRKITDDLFWVGANDNRLPLFENIHPIPDGVSYNSYLLLDEQTVLFDTADWAVCRAFMENTEYLLGGRELDVVIVNHMEPDHAASLDMVLKRWPNCKIVATAKAFAFMKQFGFVTEGHECVQTKEGMTMSFGKHTVTFIMASMVHWPEVMVTFDKTDGVLFSADAFGSFKSLNGALFNDEVNFDRDWLDEARRYYTNIVGKYGMPVQGLLKKAAPLLGEIKFICPLHGPVWRSDFGYIAEKHQLWSTYTPEAKEVMIAYASMYGNTESAALALAAKLFERGVKACAYDVSKTHVSYLISEAFRCSHIVFASCTYNLGIYPPMESFLHDMKALALQNRRYAIVENGTWAIKSGELMQAFIEGQMKNMTLIDEKLTITSSLGKDGEESLDRLADAIAKDIKSA